MAIAFQSSSKNAQSSWFGNRLTLGGAGMPSGVANGDFLLAVIGLNGSTLNSGDPADWTQIVAETGQTNPRLYAYWQIYAGNNSPFWTIASNVAATLIIARFTGVNATTPLDVTTTTFDGGISATIDSAAITPVTPGAMLVGGLAINSSTVAITKPTQMTLIDEDHSGNGKSTAMAYEAWDGSSAIVRTWTNGNRAAAGFMAALRPILPPAGGGVLILE